MFRPSHRRPRTPLQRRAATLVLSAVLMVVLLGMVAFGIDCGYLVLVKTQLQNAADSAALAAGFHLADQPLAITKAQEFGNQHSAAGRKIQIAAADVESGIWEADKRVFTPTGGACNAIRVTARCSDKTGGEAQLFFGQFLGLKSVDMQASAIVSVKPRDIAFVVDLSGSMNDDTEAAWAEALVDGQFGSGTSKKMMDRLYSDFGFGSYPGPTEFIGETLGITQDKYAYAELSSDSGPLANTVVDPLYRIEPGMTEEERKVQVYSWIIDNQLAKLMPKAQPTPTSSNYKYWEKYLDYVLMNVYIDEPDPSDPPPPPPPDPTPDPGPAPDPGPPPPPPPTPPPPPPPPSVPPPSGKPPAGSIWPKQHDRAFAGKMGRDLRLLFAGLQSPLTGLLESSGYDITPPYHRGNLPPNQDSNRITYLNNPNKGTWPSATSEAINSLQNRVGYLTYVQFMLDLGSDTNNAGYTPYSANSTLCPLHAEATAGGTFDFPPRAQPEHAARRSLIMALSKIRDRNLGIPSINYRDQVTIVTFDNPNNGDAQIVQPLTADYTALMATCAKLQAVNDNGASTATEAGMIEAKIIAKPSAGGAGREYASKVVVLLTDGVPNTYRTDYKEIYAYTEAKPSSEYYKTGQYYYEAPLMQAAIMKSDKWDVYPVGLGMATDYDFMDRMARISGTAKAGQAYRSSGDPDEYEQALAKIFDEIMRPKVQLVQ